MDKMDSLIRIYESHKMYLGKKSLPPVTVNFDDFISTFFCPGPFYYYVIDSPTLSLDFVSPSVKDVLGIAPEDFNFDFFVENLHPDDVDYFMKCEDRVANFLTTKISPDKVVKYKITYCLREKTKDNSYRLFLLQTVTLQTTEDGSLLKVFGLQTDVSHLIAENNYKLSLIGLSGEPSFLELDVFRDDFNKMKPSLFSFTKRELEVMRLLGEGYTTREIAGKLFVSVETINSHRKNMLSKTGFKNTTQLLAYCIRRGLI